MSNTDDTTPTVDVESFLNPAPSADDDVVLPAKEDANVNIVEVRGKPRVSFQGFEQLQLDEAVKEKVFDTYRDLLLDLYRVTQEHDRPHDAWHIGRVLDEYRVTEPDTPYGVAELDIFNPVGEMYGRRLRFARGIYVFWPDQGYDESHSVTALGEFAWAALQAGREEEAREGYERLRDNGEKLLRMDGRFWKKLENGTVEEIIEVVASTSGYDTRTRVSEAVKRVLLLTNQSPDVVSEGHTQELIRDAITE